jgi:hypothetical protein
MYNDKGDKMFDLTLLTTAGSETGKIGEMIERKSREILQVCLAEFIMLGAGKTGSFALSQTKVDLFLQAIGAYLDLIEEVFNTNAVPRLFELNPQFKCDELPKIRHADIKDMDLNNMGNYVAKLIGAGAIQPDDELSNYLRQAAGLPEALEELEVIGPREQAEMQQQQFQANLEAKAAAKSPDGKAGKVAKPKEEEEEGDEEKPAGVKGKEVEKWVESDNKRVNRFHDEKTGRFASSSSSMTYEEWKNRNNAPSMTIDGVPLADIQAMTVDTERFGVLLSVLDMQNLDPAERDAYLTNLDKILQVFGVQSANDIVFKTLPDGVMGTNAYNANMMSDGSITLKQTVTIDFRQQQLVQDMWANGQAAIKAGRIPYNASAYAKSAANAPGTTVVHEAGHALMVEYTLKQPQNTWNNAQNPAHGTTEWRTTVETAASSGWEGPSEYARTDLGEMWAESVAMYGELGTTKSKSVDTYLQKVVTSESTGPKGSF